MYDSLKSLYTKAIFYYLHVIRVHKNFSGRITHCRKCRNSIGSQKNIEELYSVSLWGSAFVPTSFSRRFPPAKDKKDNLEERKKTVSRCLVRAPQHRSLSKEIDKAEKNRSDFMGQIRSPAGFIEETIKINLDVALAARSTPPLWALFICFVCFCFLVSFSFCFGQPYR